MVESGGFVFDTGGETQYVGPLEAVNFQKDILYNRHITQTAKIHLFRYHTQNSVLGGGKVVFADTERIRSTIALLHISERYIHPDEFARKRALFADLINQYLLENAQPPQENRVTDPQIEQALTHIDENLHRKINLAALAEEHYLSYVQFSRRFKKAVGVTPQNYIVARRLNKAKGMLADTDLTIRQIAQSCGFASEYYFSNFFRKYCHMSPTKYRNMIKTTESAS